MGKGKRVREMRAAEKETQKALLARKAKKDKVTKMIAAIVAIVLVVGLVGGVLYHTISTATYNSGKVQRNTVVLKTDNYKVDAAMLSYYFNYEYNTLLNSYSDSLSSLGLDTSKSLKSQACPYYSDGGSWYDYFRDAAASTAKSNLYLAEKAKNEGISLNDADLASVQAIIDDYYGYAETNKVSKNEIFSLMFGKGVQEVDVRNCLELSTLASKFVRAWEDKLDFSDEQIDAYYDKNKSSFELVDYLSYAVKAEDTAKKETYEAAKNKADQLAALSDAERFKAWVENEYRTNNPLSEKLTQEDQDKGAKEAVENIEYTAISAGMVGNTKASDWLFKDAKVGQTYVVDDEKGTYTVYLSLKNAYRDEDATHTLRQIILTDSAEGKEDETKNLANKLLAEMKKAGLKDETFATYAAEYSKDSNTSAIGGFCENYKDSALLSEVADWVNNENRKEGDFEAVAFDGGYSICYYIGEGIPSWKAECISGLSSEKYTASFEEWEKEISLTENEKGYDKISLL